ncbi:MAG: tRNA-dihydrouridine synthase family protein [Clostridium sp.]|nr:tRNA-dihydrouridine synthase family protein [Clostridium sp.]
MKYYFAPLEGVTGYIYRNAHNRYFKKVDKYFMPFISPTQNKGFTSRETNDINPVHNNDINVIPQILTNNAEYFIRTMKELEELGYREINLNLGCPSGTVVAKGKGSGFLANKEELDEFLEAVFKEATIKISIKTRIGKDSPEEFKELIKIFNKYPLEELIIHPRVQKDFYKNTPNMEVFKEALSLSKNPVCYNGDIYKKEDFKKLIEECPSLDRIMLGRGLIANPALAEELEGGVVADKDTIKSFYEEVYNGYKEILSGDKNVLFKMKEFWFYMINIFEDNEKYAKKIRKAKSLKEYDSIVIGIFKDLNIANDDIRGFKYKN